MATDAAPVRTEGIEAPRLTLFSEAITRVSEQHRTPLESAIHADRAELEAADVFHLVESNPQNTLTAYKFTFSQLALLLHAFLLPERDNLKKQAAAILDLRMHSGLCRMTWRFAQQHPDSPELLNRVIRAATRKDLRDRHRFLTMFPEIASLMTASLPDRLLERYRHGELPDMESFLAAYELDPDSALAHQVYIRFFSDADLICFLSNKPAFGRLVNRLADQGEQEADEPAGSYAAAEPLARLLVTMQPQDFERSWMLRLLEVFGQPDTPHPLWKEIGEEACARIGQWLILEKLRGSLFPAYRKIRVLSSVADRIENVITDPEQNLVYVYLLNAVLVNLPEKPDTMMLYPRRLFSETFDRYTVQRSQEEEGESSPWPLNTDLIRPARIAILSPDEEAGRRRSVAQIVRRGEAEIIVELTFEDTPILYARQFILDVLG